jgi:hypothetical protein
MTHAGDGSMADKPKNAMGMDTPDTEQPVNPHAQPDRPVGERQDGPGVAARHHDRHDALPAGATGRARLEGQGGPQGHPEEPDAAHRGKPALFESGAAKGSGASAGGARHGEPEEPATDSAGGAGRDRHHR